MTMGEDGSIRVPLHIDVSAVSDDLAQIDREVSRLQQRMVSAFNRSSLVRRGRVPRATGIEDVGEQRGAWTPELRQLDRQLGARLQAIERAARAGATRPPQTPQQAAQQAARDRLGQIERQTRPIEITARAKFFDDMRAGLMRGMPNMAAMAAAQGGVPGAAGMARLLMGLVGDNPILAGIVAAGAGGVALNVAQAGFQRTQASLASALVGGPAFGTTRTLLGLAVNAAAQGIDTSSAEGQAVAQNLAMAGVSQGNLLGNLSNVLMVSKPNAIPSKDVGSLVAALGTAGGMSAQQINTTLQDVVNLAGGATGSLQELLQGMKALSGGAVAAARDVYSLAAIQRAVGPTSGINAGSLMSSVMGATGSQALQAAGLLGMSPAAFQAAQASPAGMASIYDRIAAFARRTDRGPAGTLVTEQLLSQTGLLNMQGLSPTQQAGLIQAMVSAPPGQAYARAQAYIAQARHQRLSQAASYRAAATGADVVTSGPERLWIAAQNAVTQWANTPVPIGSAAAAWVRAHPPKPPPGGAVVPSMGGGYVPISKDYMGYYAQAAAATGVPLSVLLSQAAQETGTAYGLDPTSRSGGLGQFTPDTLRRLKSGADEPASMRKFFQHFNPYNAKQAAMGQAIYDEYLIGKYGSVVGGLNAYNSGRPTVGYGQHVSDIAHTLNITVTVKDDRGQTLAHQVNHARVRVGHTQHGHPKPVPPHMRGGH